MGESVRDARRVRVRDGERENGRERGWGLRKRG